MVRAKAAEIAESFGASTTSRSCASSARNSDKHNPSPAGEAGVTPKGKTKRTGWPVLGFARKPNERGLGVLHCERSASNTHVSPTRPCGARRWRGGLAPLPPSAGAYPRIRNRLKRPQAGSPVHPRILAGACPSGFEAPANARAGERCAITPPHPSLGQSARTDRGEYITYMVRYVKGNVLAIAPVPSRHLPDQRQIIHAKRPPGVMTADIPFPDPDIAEPRQERLDHGA